VSKSLASWRSCSWLAGSPHAVDHAPALGGRALRDLVGPAQHMGVGVHLQEFARLVQLPLGQRAVPGPDGHVGDGVVVAHHVAVLGQAAVQHVHLALDLHGVAVDGVLDLDGRVGIEVPEAAAQERRAAHLPEQPDRHSARAACVGRKAPNFSAR
jgi:hypothetical protein